MPVRKGNGSYTNMEQRATRLDKLQDRVATTEKDSRMINQWCDHVRRTYSPAIGRFRRELVTPALIMDLDGVRRNIRFMTDRLATLKARLRPHIKCQKSPELARMQMDAGAIGVCTATVWESIVMSQSGINDVLIANQVGGRDKIAALARQAKHGYLTVAVD